MVGNFIKEKRNEMSLTQKELAKEIGVTQSYINLIELNKRKIGKNKIDDFARVLKVSRKVLEKENHIDSSKDNNDYKILQTRKKINKQKVELDVLIQKMKESLGYLEQAKEVLDIITDDIDN